MPYNRNKPGIAAMRHHVILCRQSDVITEGNVMQIVRTVAMEPIWAEIQEKRTTTFSVQGSAINEEKNKRTHIIRVRYRSDLNISYMAWLYNKRLTSSPRWFKILSTAQTEFKGSLYYLFDCRLVERGDDIMQPSTSPATKMPDGVKL